MDDSELKTLLKHPDPQERQLALKLDTVSPTDVATAILDPHPDVFKAAFYHPQSQHALNILAANSRDAAGNPLNDRHDLLINDPRCTPEHLDSIYRAVQQDKYLPVDKQAARLSVLKLRAPLHKKEEEFKPNQIRLANTPDPLEKHVKVSQEENRHPELLQQYNKAVNSTNPIGPEAADLHDPGSMSPKVVYKVPGEGGGWLVKPYLEDSVPHSGWNEGTSQELYHAAEIPHLHQKSFVASYNNGDQHIPATVIHLEEAKPIHKMSKQEILEKNPKADEEARKVAIMDFLTSNKDRHSGNLMVKPNGQLLAIDHGLAFSYLLWRPAFANHCRPAFAIPTKEMCYAPSRTTGTNFKRFTQKATSLLTDAHETNDLDYHRVLKHWWPLVSPDVKRAFQKRLELIQNPAIRRHLEAGFNARHKWLDDEAKREPEEFLEDLQKSVMARDTAEEVIQEPESINYDTVHKELLNTHPAHLQPRVDQFEQYVNHPTNPVKADPEDFEGSIEQKSLVTHAGNKYLLKAASTPWNPLSGWGEMTSQAMYHAGGIGHLHQHVHATNLNIKKGNTTRQQPAYVVHFRPGNWNTLNQLGRNDYKKDFINKNERDLQKIYLMDFLTGNGDRHDGNIVVGPNGEPQAIDQAFAFRSDNWDTPEDQERHKHEYKGKGEAPKNEPFKFSILDEPFSVNTFAKDHCLGLMANEDTYNWWQRNKKPIVEAFQKHLDMIPDKKERANRKGMFDYRVNAIDRKHPLLFNLSKSEEDDGLEELEKAISDLPVGRRINKDSVLQKYNYDHILTPEQRKQGYSLMVEKINSKYGPMYYSNIYHRGTHVGDVMGVGHTSSVEPHSEIAKEHRGKGLGIAGYEALFSHLKNKEGVVNIAGLAHTEAAHRVHVSLAKKHGLNYSARKLKVPYEKETGSDYGQTPGDNKVLITRGKYSYTLKAELPVTDQLDESNLEPIYFGNGINKSEDLSKGSMQRLHPFNPREPGIPETYGASIDNWVSGEDPKAREELGLMGMSPEAKARSLHKLHASTEVRRNPKTNEREFLLHRGFSNSQLNTLRTPGKFDSTKPRTDKTKKQRAIPYTSWSVDPDQTHTADHMVSAWVPESKIAFYVPQYKKLPGLSGEDNNLMHDEKEAIVEPGQYDIFHQGNSNDWLLGVKNKIVSLHKSLEGAQFLHDQNTAFHNQQSLQANTTGVHEQLMRMHPSAVSPGVRHYELAINLAKNPVQPTKSQKELEGVQPKALYHHNGKGYLVKPAVENSTALGAWNELASQGLYHAAGIGHLHQKVHASIGKTGLNRPEPAHALAIHIEPDSMTFNDANGWTDAEGKLHPGKDLKRAQRTLKNPEHKESLRRIGMMDFLTSNGDRHGANIVIKPDGSPVAIDHGRAFWTMRKHALGNETENELEDKEGSLEPTYTKYPGFHDFQTKKYEDAPEQSAVALLGGKPTEETWNWWHNNKANLLNEFKRYLNVLPDYQVKKKMLDAYMVKHNLLDRFSQGLEGNALQEARQNLFKDG